MSFKKSQTATEYLVILAVVIVIALIVVGVMGGIPSIGGGASASAAKAALASQKIAITNFAVSDYDTDLLIQNNHQERVEIDTISINGEECLFFYGTQHIFAVGQKKTITCQNVYEIEQDKVNWLIEINWTDLNTGARYTQSGSDLALVGAVSNEYLSTLQANSYWDASINGCYNTSDNPIRICTCIDLNKTRDNLDTDHQMENSVDFIRCNAEFGVDFRSGSGWEKIGGSYTAFFEGGNNIISNLKIDTNLQNIGLFNSLSSSSSVSNLGLNTVDIDAEVFEAQGVGSLADRAFGTVNNVFATGLIKGYSDVGGIMGLAGGSVVISNVFFKGTLSGNRNMGSIVGFLEESSGTLRNSFGIANFDFVDLGDGYGTTAGGLAGYMGGNLQNSYAIVTFDRSLSSGGGLVGEDEGNLDITNSYWLNTSENLIETCVGTDSHDNNGCTAVLSINDIPIR